MYKGICFSQLREDYEKEPLSSKVTILTLATPYKHCCTLWTNRTITQKCKRDIGTCMTCHIFSKSKWTQKYNVPMEKKKGISVYVFCCLLFIHGMPSFHLKLFHIRICRHFSNAAMVYNTWCSNPQMKTQGQPWCWWPTHRFKYWHRSNCLLPLFREKKKCSLCNMWWLFPRLSFLLMAELFSIMNGITRQRYSMWTCETNIISNWLEKLQKADEFQNLKMSVWFIFVPLYALPDNLSNEN